MFFVIMKTRSLVESDPPLSASHRTLKALAASSLHSGLLGLVWGLLALALEGFKQWVEKV